MLLTIYFKRFAFICECELFIWNENERFFFRGKFIIVQGLPQFNTKKKQKSLLLNFDELKNSMEFHRNEMKETNKKTKKTK